MDFRLIVAGKDITEDVSVHSAVIDLGINGLSDNATITFNDAEMKWADWGIGEGEDIELKDGADRILAGIVRTCSTASGVCELEVGQESRIPAMFAVTLDGTVESVLRMVAEDVYQTTCAFTGDFGFRLHGEWFHDEVWRLINGLSKRFDFYYYNSTRGLRFITGTALEREPADMTLTIMDGDIYSFVEGEKLGALTITNGKSRGVAKWDEGFGSGLIIHEGEATDDDLKAEAEATLRQRNRNDDFVLIRSLDDGVIIPGTIVDVQAPAKAQSGRFIVTANRIHIDRNRQSLRGVKLS